MVENKHILKQVLKECFYILKLNFGKIAILRNLNSNAVFRLKPHFIVESENFYAFIWRVVDCKMQTTSSFPALLLRRTLLTI